MILHNLQAQRVATADVEAVPDLVSTLRKVFYIKSYFQCFLFSLVIRYIHMYLQVLILC